MVEPGEMRTAALRILDRDGDRDQCVTFDEFLPRPEGAPDAFVVALPQEDPSRPRPTSSEVLQDLEAFVPLLAALRRRYDVNRDQRFSSEELNWSPEHIRRLDEDGDGLLSARDLQRVPERTPDLELAIELVGAGNGPAIRVAASPGAVIDQTPRTDLLRVRMAGVQLTFSHRETDPVREAVDTALRLFNQLDRDANGYLDAAEALARGPYFHESVFLEADRDGDGQLFGPELEEHVAARATPLANCCRVNVYNTGFGLFQQLDASGDGRISLRELRTVERVLYELMSEEAESLAPQAGGRHLHIEFVRGSFQLTGPNDGMVSQTPAFAERPPVGPDWFRAMDRNSDGDLTFQEFLGPREAFHALDADGDGLIDFREADAADDARPPGTGPFPVSETARSPAAASVRRDAPDSPQP
jgi:Ca2+-binding EF-hand superfamily protein